MDERSQTSDDRQQASRLLCVSSLLALFVSLSIARGEHYPDAHDSSKTSWNVDFDRAKVRLERHERDGYEYHSGTAAEAVQFRSTGETNVRLSHPVPTSLVIDELTATIWIRSNRTGTVLAARITLPHELDPRSGEPVAFDLRGDRYETPQQWQQMTCRTDDELIERQLKLIRGRLARRGDGRPLNLNGMHVSEVVLVIPAERGTTELLIDDLRYGPIVRATEQGIAVAPDPVGERTNRPPCPIRVETNRLLVNGKPFFPRMLPYHGENLETLSTAGANVAWVEHYDDRILIDALAERGIWSMASPPKAAAGDGEVASAAGLMPISDSTSSILFWNVGTRVPPKDLGRVEVWIDQLRDADRAFAGPRPVAADVIGEERRFSRYVSLLGSSRHMLHTTLSPLQYRDYLIEKQKLALPDRFKWSWIQTEPADGNVIPRPESRFRPAMVEAEQIWLQAWTAISVGHKAIGFWKSSSLDEQTPAAEERRLALALLNSQIDLLEPWLATGKVVDTVPVSVTLKQSPDLGRRGYSFRNSPSSRGELDALLSERQREQDKAGRIKSEVHAAVIESSYGRLVIPVWYEAGAQFQPGQMAAQDVTVLVRSVDDARAWQVTSTAVTPVDMQRVAGGMQVSLPMLNQHAFVVITTDAGIERKLQQQVRLMRKRSGQLWVELAKARLERVQRTHAEIEETAAPKIPDAPFLLASASEMVTQATEQLQAEQFSEAEKFARYSLQLLRQLQRSHWENAVAGLTAPTSSPHAVCFETLPDHWRLVARIGRSTDSLDENLLRSGNFEDLDTMAAEGWEQLRTAVADPQRKIAELHDEAMEGQFCLRMRSSSAEETVTEHLGPDVAVAAPPVSVRGGQVLLIGGQVRVDQIANGEVDGLMVYDSIMGTVGALRWTRPSPGGEWESFQILREVPTSRDVQLMFELHGDGDVRFDDVRLVALSTLLETGGLHPQRFGSERRRNLLDFAPTLPKVNLWPGRKSVEQAPSAAQPSP